MTEQIKGYEGLYFITSNGKVFANARSWICGNGAIRHLPEHELSYSTDRKYKRVTLVKDGKYKSFSVHRLVAETFIPNPDNKPCVDHINRNMLDNNVENLRWCTIRENNSNRGGKYAR